VPADNPTCSMISCRVGYHAGGVPCRASAGPVAGPKSTFGSNFSSDSAEWLKVTRASPTYVCHATPLTKTSLWPADPIDVGTAHCCCCCAHLQRAGLIGRADRSTAALREYRTQHSTNGQGTVVTVAMLMRSTRWSAALDSGQSTTRCALRLRCAV
jgi:hypothetical protein